MNKKPLKILFDSKGNLLYYATGWRAQQSDVKSEDNCIFNDRLVYTGYSEHVLEFKSLVSDRKYHMFLRHFDEVLQHKKLNDNILEGQFIFTKHGTIQGLRMVLPKLPLAPATP